MADAPDHRWWHDGRGWRHAFCLFCGGSYALAVDSGLEGTPCPAPSAAGGEEEAQRILAKVRLDAVRRGRHYPDCYQP